MPVRLKEHCKILDCPVVTVFQGPARSSRHRRSDPKRVLKRMKEMNYQPNLTARALNYGQTWTMASWFPDLLHPFFASIAQSLSHEIRSKGYSLLISSSDEDAGAGAARDRASAGRAASTACSSLQRSGSVDSFRRIEAQKTRISCSIASSRGLPRTLSVSTIMLLAYWPRAT